MQEGEGRPLGGLERVDELLYLRVAFGVGRRPPAGLRRARLEERLGAVAAAEIAPRGRDRGQLVAEVLGQDKVAVDDREVGEREPTRSARGSRSGSQSSGGQRWVCDSWTFRSYEPPRSVKRLSGWSRKSGSPPGRSPVRIAGTAPVVHSCTVVVFRYQVASSASRAKFG